MKTLRSTLRCLAPITILLAVIGHAATFTDDTVIGINNTNFEGVDIAVTNCTLTVDGSHAFLSVRLLNGALLTHSSSTNGLLENRFSTTGELHTLSSTNPPALNATAILTNTIVVTNPIGGIYQAGFDYGFLTTNNFTYLTWLPGSTIPDGAMISVSYDFLAAPVAAGLFLTVSNSFEIDSGAAVNASARGYGGGYGPGAGAALSTNYPYPFVAGSGGGHGGYGAPSTSHAAGGNVSGSPLLASDYLGSGGGAGSGPGAPGGGVSRLAIGGLLRLDGGISADGAKGINPHSGGGAGGGIFLSAQTFSGAGSASADGGAGESPDGGGGGGGRIAIYYATNLFTGSISAHGGASAIYGGAGTIYTLASADNNGQVVIDNSGGAGTNTPLPLSTGFDLTIGSGAVVQSTPLNVRSLLIRSNGWLTSSQGQSQSPVTLTIVCSNAVIMEGGGINSEGKGFGGGSGTSAGHSITLPAGVSGGGGGYGGYGGPSSLGAAGGAYYGSLRQPSDFGSGGGAGAGRAPYNLGRITANGSNGFGQGSGRRLWRQRVAHGRKIYGHGPCHGKRRRRRAANWRRRRRWTHRDLLQRHQRIWWHPVCPRRCRRK